MVVKNILTDSQVELAGPKPMPEKMAGKPGVDSEAKPGEEPISKAYKLSDGGGLSLVVNPNGSKWWHFRYRFDDREGKIYLGVYPKVTLGKAREMRDKCQDELDTGSIPAHPAKMRVKRRNRSGSIHSA